jgi:pyruvate formate lyase activating enzyme
MKIEIKGFLENSLVEWEGKISSVIFFPRCNFRCPYCQNSQLVLHPEKIPSIPFSEIKKYLLKEKGWVDGVSLTGGEPTIYSQLPEFIKKIKKLGLLVNLETNGSNPEMLRKLIKEKLIDYVSMDIKNQFKETPYNKAAGVKVDLEKIRESVKIIRNSGVDYEFRTTVVPQILGKKEVGEITKSISGASKFILQQFRPRETLDPKFEKVKPYSPNQIEEMLKLAGKYVRNSWYR